MNEQLKFTNLYKITEENLAIRREFIRLGEKDRNIILELIPWAKKVAPKIAKEFYDFQFSFAPTRTFFENMAKQKNTSIDKLRIHLEKAQSEYFYQIFTGARDNWGVKYFERRLVVGSIHDRIDLPQKWYLGSYSLYQDLTRKYLRSSAKRFIPGGLTRAEAAIFKVFNYDQQAVCDAFLFNTVTSLGLSVEDINPRGNEDRTERIEEVKSASAKLLKQAQAIAEQELDDEVHNVAVPGVLGTAFGEMVRNLKKNRDEMDTAMQQIEANMAAAQQVVDEVNRVAALLADGHLDARAEVESATGSFAQLISGFNAAIDNILRPVTEAVTVIEYLANSDLTQYVSGEFQGDHAKMKDALNGALTSLNGILGQVSQSVLQVSTGANEVAMASNSLSDGATKQASAVEEISASMNEISSQTKLTAENAIQAKQLATEVKSGAEQGNDQMQKMLSAMTEINNSSEEISKIIKSIDEIAFQTNLLALNAAVEAARAGVHGKGFAVVAEEVRNLAQRSARAAQETTELIQGSGEKVQNGTAIANETAKSLAEIVQGVTKVADLVNEIASASNEQAQGIEQVNAGLTQIDDVTQANTASAEQSAAAAEALSAQAEQLKHLLSRFKLAVDQHASAGTVSSPAGVTVVHDSDASAGNEPQDWGDPAQAHCEEQLSTGSPDHDTIDL